MLRRERKNNLQDDGLLKKELLCPERVDLAEVNKLIRDIDEVVADISNQIDELETKIRTQNEQVAEMKALLDQKEEEKKQLEKKIDDIQKERESLQLILKEEREKFDNEMRRIMITLVSWLHAFI